MTRDDHRAQCIEAMARTMCCQYYVSLQGVIRFGTTEVLAAGVKRDVEEHWREWHDKATEVLDSLHGIAVVYARDDDCYIYCHGGRMLIGDADLTNPPEEKP